MRGPGDLAYLRGGEFGCRVDRTAGAGNGRRCGRYACTLDAQVLRGAGGGDAARSKAMWVEQPYLSDDGLCANWSSRARAASTSWSCYPSGGDSRLMDSANLLAARTLVQGGCAYVYPGMTYVKAALYDGWACLWGRRTSTS